MVVEGRSWVQLKYFVKVRETWWFGLKLLVCVAWGTFVVMVRIINTWLRFGNDRGHG